MQRRTESRSRWRERGRNERKRKNKKNKEKPTTCNLKDFVAGLMLLLVVMVYSYIKVWES